MGGIYPCRQPRIPSYSKSVKKEIRSLQHAPDPEQNLAEKSLDFDSILAQADQQISRMQATRAQSRSLRQALDLASIQPKDA